MDTMALAVEGSALMLIGVSRAYKESSNCRMEAQYGLQKKKPLIPLKLVEGYEADGWLGLLLGTSMWYAMYGATLASESSFDDRMTALSREIGSRGRADAVVVAQADETDEAAPSGEGAGAESDEMAELRSELQSMRMTALQKRAVSEGVSPEAIDDAMDGSDPKSSLVALIVDVTSMRGPADRMVMALCAGGESAADALTGALDHAMDVLEHLSVSSPRKSRKSVRELLESFEELSESVDESWCDGVSRCGSDRLEALASDVVSVLGVASGECGAECVSLVSSLLDSLRECGSVAVQCESLLGAGVGSEEGARLSALECVRGLSPAWLGRVDASSWEGSWCLFWHLPSRGVLVSLHGSSPSGCP